MVLHCENLFRKNRKDSNDLNTPNDRQQIIQQQRDRQRMMQEGHLAGRARSNLIGSQAGSQSSNRRVVFLPFKQRWPGGDAA